MSSRRKFVSNIIKGTAAGMLLPELMSAKASTHTFPLNLNHTEAYWSMIRSMFPLKKDFIYLNNGTIGPSPYPVIEEEYKVNMEVNAGAQYGGKVEEALEDMARFVKAKKENIAFTHNVTEGINIGIWSLPLMKGDEVIISTHEHVGNAVPWLNRAKQDGIILKPIKLMPTAAEMLALVERSITKKTKVIALPHIPCTIGQVLPMKEICKLARSKNIYTMVDGAHGAGMLNLDLVDMGCDMYASCCHKWMLGPKGTGFIYVRDEMIEPFVPKYIGAYGDTGWDLMGAVPVIKGYVPTAHRFFFGTQNAAHYAGISAAIRFNENIGTDVVTARIKSLADHLQDELLLLGDKIEMLTPTEAASKAGVIAFKIKKLPFGDAQKMIGEEKITIRGVAENGVNCLRISTHIYNNKEEINKVVDVIKKIA